MHHRRDGTRIEAFTKSSRETPSPLTSKNVVDIHRQVFFFKGDPFTRFLNASSYHALLKLSSFLSVDKTKRADGRPSSQKG